MLKKLIPLLICFPLFLKAQSIEVCPKCPINTIAQAVAKAKKGDTIIVQKGTYPENNILLDKPITLIGKDRPIINGQFKGSILKIQADSITIKGFRLANVPFKATEEQAAILLDKSKKFLIEDNIMDQVCFGVLLRKGRDGIIKNNKISSNATQQYNSGNAIHLWSCKNIKIIGNEAANCRDGIYIQFSSKSYIEGNYCYKNLRYGLHFMFSDDNEYYRNKFSENGAGAAVMFSKRVKMVGNTFQDNWGPSSYGLLLKELYDSELVGNTFYRNTIGINGENCTRMKYNENTFTENGWGIRIRGGCYQNDFWDNNFFNNTFDVAYDNNVNDNKFRSNYWSDYTGYDLNKDGVGDVPYRPVKLFSYISNRTPESIVLLRSLFIDIMNFSEKVAPVFTPENLIDETPRMEPVKKTKQ
ncbi:nitrous oxide reductase family maturation protein NosD [Capnocytophaga gingivalis]|uniref:Nitrous oxide reductase family maturation protein NosD n=1 Tax=Capnocytophaga gingivalis TaxID=1017 RepID=A0ABU5Z6V1_9FLAO|nr:nitrous oxide reductase family maturation protein NosD [Capnocytophaga gingivalis]MEB3074138.1 nitrous oxide reductase family maturation protein NosD [Capnocytophaga gingivalis]